MAQCQLWSDTPKMVYNEYITKPFVSPVAAQARSYSRKQCPFKSHLVAEFHAVESVLPGRRALLILGGNFKNTQTFDKILELPKP